MAHAEERMKAMRKRRRARGLRELRLVIPDARSKAVRKRVAVRRERIGRLVGHLDDKDISRVNIALAFVMGLAD
jgi:hypothetical protein